MWPAHVEQIRREGLKITAAEAGEFQVPVRAIHLGEVAALRPEFDLVFVCVKSYDTEWAGRFIVPHVAPGGAVVSAQNSLNEELLGPIVGYPRIVGAVVTLGAGLYAPGHVTRTTLPSRSPFSVGEPSGVVTPRARAIAEILNAVGPSKMTGNLWGERWSKLAMNCMGNALASITRMNHAEMRRSREIFDITVQLGSETVRVAEALGVRVEPINGIEPGIYLDAARGKGVEELHARWVEGGRSIGAGRPSLFQDVLKGRRTEIEYLNGLVARKGRETGVATPMNDAIVALTRQVEAGTLASSPENVKLLAPHLPAGG
jgi:2-dehydropantoate 2-reductase